MRDGQLGQAAAPWRRRGQKARSVGCGSLLRSAPRNQPTVDLPYPAKPPRCDGRLPCRRPSGPAIQADSRCRRSHCSRRRKQNRARRGASPFRRSNEERLRRAMLHEGDGQFVRETTGVKTSTSEDRGGAVRPCLLACPLRSLGRAVRMNQQRAAPAQNRCGSVAN